MAFKVVDGLRTIEFGTPGQSRKELTDLVIDGNKRATAGTAQEYLDENEVIEHIGEELYLLDNDEKVVGKVRVTEVTQCAFSEVPDRFALAEAEGDLNGDDFRRSHSEFWNRIGVEVNDQTPIVLVYFDLVEKY
jgi:uncharacterized protein YhfF